MSERIRICYETAKGNHATRWVNLPKVAGETEQGKIDRARNHYRTLYPMVRIVSIRTC